MGEIAEYSHQRCGDDLRRGRVYMAYLYEQFQEYIVQDDAHTHQQRIPEQLHAPLQVRFLEHDIFGQCKSYREADTERYHERKYVRRNSYACNMYRLLHQYIVVADKIYQDVRYSIGAATSKIPEGLLAYYVLEGFVKEINYTQYYMSDSLKHCLLKKDKNKVFSGKDG